MPAACFILYDGSLGQRCSLLGAHDKIRFIVKSGNFQKHILSMIIGIYILYMVAFGRRSALLNAHDIFRLRHDLRIFPPPDFPMINWKCELINTCAINVLLYPTHLESSDCAVNTSRFMDFSSVHARYLVLALWIWPFLVRIAPGWPCNISGCHIGRGSTCLTPAIALNLDVNSTQF